MLRALRIVFTWLLAAALPLQGWAAASMTFCGTPEVGVPAHHQAVDPAGGHEGHHDDAAPPEAAAKCSVCAACCASMAIAGAHFSLPLVALTESFASPGGTAAAPFVTEGLERPPRTSFSA